MCIKSITTTPLMYPNYKDITFSKMGVLDKPIYKYYPFKYLLNIMANRMMLINKVNSWDDVYENFLFKQPLYSGGMAVNWVDYTDCIYGQCWSYLKSSDAMWRIYSEVPRNINQVDDVAIRVQTTTKKLWDILYTSDACMSNLRISDVNYLNDHQIHSWLNMHSTITSMSDLNDLLFESLFIKRTPFIHEQELRVIIMEEHQGYPHPKFLSYNIDPNTFFDELVIEPRIMDPQILSHIENQIRQYCPNIPLRQSQLYKLHHQVRIQI